MSRLIESVLVYNGHVYNWSFHLERMRNSLWQHFGCLPFFNFEKMFAEASQQQGRVKLKIIYDNQSFSYSFKDYTTRKIQSLRLVHDDCIEYGLKFENRKSLDDLFKRKSGADDILIIKKGLITDSYYCNVALLSKGSWFTPWKPLLCGTKREQLIRSGIIHPKKITLTDLPHYSQICLFNAMIDFKKILLPVNRIIN
ncbi:MAG: chorismate-binding protein [Saprospiraceae bacterium]|nr:chorismate-binding protein [Saprospiraceae bacterium]